MVFFVCVCVCVCDRIRGGCQSLQKKKPAKLTHLPQDAPVSISEDGSG